MDLIDRDVAIEAMRKWATQPVIMKSRYFDPKGKAIVLDMIGTVAEQPTVDAVPVVRCKDCKQWDEEGSYMGRGWCGYQMKSTGPRYFCADGEVEEDEDG